MLPSMAARGNRHPTIAILGAGNLGNALAPALADCGYPVAEISSRPNAASRKRAAALARRIGARPVVLGTDEIQADLIWLCVPDRELSTCARLLAQSRWKGRIALHSSGALASNALGPLRRRGASVASVHPLMTFVPGANPFLRGVAFALEGDRQAVAAARRIISALAVRAYPIAPQDKPLYHAWATFTSPLLTILLETAERVARAAHIPNAQARQRAAPILRQTLENYLRHGAARGFSGPLIRGDANTVRRHLAVLRTVPGAREVYLALARAALQTLPARNRPELKKVLGGGHAPGSY